MEPTYTVDGVPATLEDFEREPRPAGEMDAIRALRPGETLRVGGGAFAERVIRRDTEADRVAWVLGFRWTPTGGNCNALIAEIGEGREMYIVADEGGGMAPTSLDEPVTVCIVDAAGHVESEEGHPTLADALLDLYGPIAGEDLPPEIADLLRFVLGRI